jgi:hypothetical protein
MRSQRWNDAIKPLEAYVGFGPRLGLSSSITVARIYLARAYANVGRTADARKVYEEAFHVWRDADPDLPLLVEAKAEYQRLTS